MSSALASSRVAERYTPARVPDNAIIARVREDRTDQSVLRTLTLNLARGEVELFFAISGDVLPPPLRVNDFAAAGTIFTAMREGRPLHIEGVVTAALLRNLEEFQDAWTLWRAKLKRIDITADEIVPDGAPGPRKGIIAFSGGVDGVFSVLRNLDGNAGLRSAPPACAMQVHGFDVPLSDNETFARVRRAAQDILTPLGVPLSIVRTNWKTDCCGDWNKEYVAGLAACLHQFQGAGNVGIFGSDDYYGHLIIPWGSNPITNRLFSGRYLEIYSEGGGFSRTERMKLVSQYPEIVKNLRVCWEGPVTGRNCCECEKCVRTQMNFMALGVEPTCFDTRLTMAQIRNQRVPHRIQLSYLTEILNYARQNGTSGPWTTALQYAIAKNRVTLPMKAFYRGVRGRVRRLTGI
jgi:hypothetical protein